DRDHFIAFSNPKRQESEPKRVCAIAHADGVLGAAVGRELRFEPFHERPARKRAALDYFTNGAIELVDQGGVLRLEIKKGNFHLRIRASLGLAILRNELVQSSRATDPANTSLCRVSSALG